MSRDEIRYSTWTDRHGQIQNIVDGESGVGYETPSRLRDQAEADGSDLGAARVPREEVLSDDAPARRYIEGGVQVRQELVREDAEIASLPAHQSIFSEEARRKQAEENVALLGDDLVLQVGEEDEAKGRREQTLQKLTSAKQALSDLPALAKGLLGKWIVVLIEMAVAVFDAAVVHSVLEISGLTPAAAWLSTLLIPGVIASAHVAFGALAGFIVGQISPRNQLKVAVGMFAAGFVALLVAFGLLGAFRAEGLGQINSQLAEVASGGDTGDLELFINPAWMMGLQIAGSLAAISAVALYVLGQPGRDARQEVAEATVEDTKAEADQRIASEAVASTRQQLKQAKLSVPQTAVEARQAAAELVVGSRATEARLKAEDGLGQALCGRLGVAFQYHDQTYSNGGVRRAAMPDHDPKKPRPSKRAPRDVSWDESSGPVTEPSATSRFRRWFS